MKPVPKHEHRWYEISRSENGWRLEACSEKRCIETRIVR